MDRPADRRCLFVPYQDGRETFANGACWKGSNRRWSENDAKSPPVEKLLDGEQESQVIALRLGPPPKGYANWSLRLLARRVVELGSSSRSATKPSGGR